MHSQYKLLITLRINEGIKISIRLYSANPIETHGFMGVGGISY